VELNGRFVSVSEIRLGLPPKKKTKERDRSFVYVARSGDYSVRRPSKGGTAETKKKVTPRLAHLSNNQTKADHFGENYESERQHQRCEKPLPGLKNKEGAWGEWWGDASSGGVRTNERSRKKNCRKRGAIEAETCVSKPGE